MEFESPLSQNTKAKIERLVGVTCPTSRSKVIPPLERDHLAPALLRRGRRFRFWFGRGRLHEAADLLRCTSLHIVGDMRIGIEGKSGAEVAQHTGQGFHIHAAGEGHGGESMPLRYNYDKPEKPRRIKGCEVFSLVFSSFSKPKNHTEISRIIGGVSLTTNE